MNVSIDYPIALEASRVAARIYAAAVADYRAGRIGDVEYLAARKANDTAAAAFDAAFAAEVL